MAFYDYRCPSCGRDEEAEHGMHQKPRIVCLDCGTVMHKVILGTPQIRFDWKNYDGYDHGSDTLVINASHQGKPSPQRNAAGGRT